MDPKIKSYRKLIQPLLDVNFVTTTLGIINKNMSRCIEALDLKVDGEEFDIDQIFFRCSGDMIGGMW